jgi:ectoine hydroxylase-related dioxygenase (phytanoyl-CoA dioxygenase family)
MRTWSEVKALLADPPRLWAGFVGRLSRLPFSNSQKLQYLRELKIVGSGILAAERGEDTPRAAHVALMNLFMASGGRANDLLSAAVGFFHPLYRLPAASGVLGDLTRKDLERIQRQLETDGYVVFENCLSPEFCERVVQQSLAVDCFLHGDGITGSDKSYARYERGSQDATSYVLTPDDTTGIPEVQELMSDLSLISVAQNYLKSKPIFSAVNMTWSTVSKDQPDSQAAQEFHWDMERIRWLRFFIYLTDVQPENGPHCFIRGSHRTGAIPAEILKLGYVRQSDETMLRTYGHEAFLEFTGKRGTIVAEDSRGFHKGKMLTEGDRLLLAFELSNTLFGANKRHRIRKIWHPQFREFAKKFPRIYRNCDFKPGLLAEKP